MSVKRSKTVGQAGLEPAYTDYSFMSGYKPAEIQPPMYQKNPPFKGGFLKFYET